MQDILAAQRRGADFSTLLHLLAQHLGLVGADWAKVTDTACEYVSYCTNPSLLKTCRDSLDWTMLLFFVLNNSTSTYDDGTRNVSRLETVLDILANGPASGFEDLAQYDIFACLTALLYESIVLCGMRSALEPMIGAFEGFHKRMAKEFLSGHRPDTTLEDYIELRRTTIATFWWRDILVSFLGIRVDFDERTSNAIADAVWLGNDIRSLHRDESNVLDFISEDELLRRLTAAYDELVNAFRTLPPLHREVICLIVVGTSAIYPAMDKYGGSRYACDSILAKDAQSIQIVRGLELIDQAPALVKFPLIADALQEWHKSIDSPGRCVQRNICFQKDTSCLGFGRVFDVFSSVSRVDMVTGRVTRPSPMEQFITVSKVNWIIKRCPVLSVYSESASASLNRGLAMVHSGLHTEQENRLLDFQIALAELMPGDHLSALADMIYRTNAESNPRSLCDGLGLLLELKSFVDLPKIGACLNSIELALEKYGADYIASPSSLTNAFCYWGLAGAIAKLVILIGRESFDQVLHDVSLKLQKSVVSMRAVPGPKITQGSYHMVIDMAMAKIVAGEKCIRELVCLNGVLSTSRMVCEPVFELSRMTFPTVATSEKGSNPIDGYALSSPEFTSLLAYALVETVVPGPTMEARSEVISIFRPMHAAITV